MRRILLVALLLCLAGQAADAARGKPARRRGPNPIRNRVVKVVNVGGPFNGRPSPRYQRPDYANVDLRRGKNTIVADVNTDDLRRVFGDQVRVLRASNVPFTSVPGGWVRPSRFVAQATALGVERVIATTGILGRDSLRRAFRRAGWKVETRLVPRRDSTDRLHVIVATPPSGAR